MTMDNIIKTLDFVLKSNVNDVIVWYWYNILENGEFVIEYLPKSGHDEEKMDKFKKALNLILLSAEDNGVLIKSKALNLFDSCRMRLPNATRIKKIENTNEHGPTRTSHVQGITNSSTTFSS